MGPATSSSSTSASRTCQPANDTCSSSIKEGHLQGTRIVDIDSVARPHTAIVRAGRTGLAFYHSLGKAPFFDASDVLQILEQCPNKEHTVPEQPPSTVCFLVARLRR
jgi:hypothetical protein